MVHGGMIVKRMGLLALGLVVSLLFAGCTVPSGMAPTLPTASETATPVEATAETADGGQTTAPASNLTDGCVQTYDPSVDYFPEKVSVEYASGFTVDYFDHYKVVTVLDPWQGADKTFQYVLVQCGTPAPDGYEDAAVIEVPVNDIVALSTTYLPQLDILGVTDRLVGIDSYLWTNTESVRQRIDAGEVAEVGSGSTVNVELVLDLDPDLVMAYGIGIPDYDAHPKLLEAGVPVVLNGDFVETQPLGRTEWLKFMAFFFNKEAAAQRHFAQVAAKYTEVAALANSVDEKPTVFLSSIYNGTWYMSGGNSYTAQLLADAGADYLWSDTDSVASDPYDFESVFDRAADADFWVNPDKSMWMSIDDILADDERYGDFAAVQNGGVYNNNAILNENGGNDYYESGAANPHIVLMDLVKIFHPDLLSDHELVYYRHLQ